MAVCVISQPRFFPGLHYLHRMMLTDIFVVFDTVQFTPRHEENRAKLKTPQGPRWLTVPMRQSSRGQLIRDTRVDNSQLWRRKAIGTLTQLYQRAPYFETYMPEVKRILDAPHETLTQLDLASWRPALRLLGITCRFVMASELPVSGEGSRLLLDICRYLGADTYLSGGFGRTYVDSAEFAADGVAVKFQEYEYPAYSQRFGGFVPWLSYLDTLFNTGLEPSLVLAGGRTLS